MKFIQFTYKDKPKELRVGYLEGQCIVDINKRDSRLPKTMYELLHCRQCLVRVKEIKKDKPCCTTGLKNVTLKAPIYGSDKIICSLVNYSDTVQENPNAKVMEWPSFFTKFSSTISGPGEPIILRTDVCKNVDYETELAVIIGRKASYVTEKNAYDYIFGCTIGQDISARDWQRDRNMGQVLLGKSMDTFCPLGPSIVTLDEMGNLNNLNIKTNINGVYLQNSNTRNMIHKIPKLIERLTSIMTLYPGDIIMTGTPAGTGQFQDPPLWLQKGDVIRSEIDKIGVLETRVENFVRPDPYLAEW